LGGYEHNGYKQAEQVKNACNMQRVVQNEHYYDGQRAHNTIIQNYSSYDLNLNLERLSMRK